MFALCNVAINVFIDNSMQNILDHGDMDSSSKVHVTMSVQLLRFSSLCHSTFHDRPSDDLLMLNVDSVNIDIAQYVRSDANGKLLL